jgi:small subunit ribosomal protein S6e
MVLKINISSKEGKTWKVELEPEVLAGKSIGDTVQGKDLKPELEGYEFRISGGSDFAGFPMKEDAEGIGLKRVLLTKGWGMHKRPRGDKKRVPQPSGLRLKKTVRGNQVFEKTVQVNMQVVKEGGKKLEEVFPEQNKKEEPKQEEKTEGKVEEQNTEESKPEEVKEEEKGEGKIAEESKLEEVKEEKKTREESISTEEQDGESGGDNDKTGEEISAEKKEEKVEEKPEVKEEKESEEKAKDEKK